MHTLNASTWPPQLLLKDENLISTVWGLWGGTGRNEMTSLSDWDVFCWLPTSSARQLNVNELLDTWRALGASGHIDLLLCTEEDPISDYALTNGTDLHAVYFLSSVRGSQEFVARFLKARERLQGMVKVRIREILHLLITQHAFDLMFCPSHPRSSKFCKGGTRWWTTLAEISHLRYPRNVPPSTSSAMKLIEGVVGCEDSRFTQAWSRSWKLRIEREAGQINDHELTTELQKLASLWKVAVGSTLTEMLDWMQQKAGVPSQLLDRTLHELKLERSFTIPPPVELSKSIENMLYAFLETDCKALNEMLSPDADWWTLHAIVMNKHASGETLHQLAFPPWKVNEWAWRNIRLYSAKHPNVGRRTLQQLLATPGLREMDYSAARQSLSKRPNI